MVLRGISLYGLFEPRLVLIVCTSLVVVLGTPPSGIEDTFLSVPDAKSAREHLRVLTGKAHVAGTEGDHEMARYVRDRMLEYGLKDTAIENVTAFLNYPDKPGVLRIDGEAVEIFEQILEKDPTSDTPWRNHTFLGYGASGVLRGKQVVYANYGSVEDFAILQNDLGVDVAGKVVLIRYGQVFRGLKVRNAENAGAAGVLIYSDPQEDGYAAGAVYPSGPWRPSYGVQRGSVFYNNLCSGDPARLDASRSVEEICGYSIYDLIPKIPALPISYAVALELLNKLGGRQSPKQFHGALNAPYTVGPSSSLVDLEVHNREDFQSQLPNVIATIPGQDQKEGNVRPIVLGNHRDAWVFGAADPNSGTASFLEVARGLGAAVTLGWQPRRTIVLCSWSGEEYGLVGSTAWAERNAETGNLKLKETAIAYLNVDEAVTGADLSGSGTYALRDLFESAASVVDTPVHSSSSTSFGTVKLKPTSDWVPLGSGSDYAVFLDHLGIPSMDMRFSRRSRKDGKLHDYGQYHSIYDSFAWMERFGASEDDAGVGSLFAFAHMRAIAQIWGTMAIRLADAEILPMNHTAQAEGLLSWVVAKQTELAEMGLKDTTTLEAAIAQYRSAAEGVEEEIAQIRRSIGYSAATVADLNDRLAFTERQFLYELGLPGRKWFRSLLQAPSFDKGYAAQVFPSLWDGYREGGARRALEELHNLEEAVKRAAKFLKGASDDRKQSGGGGNKGLRAFWV